MGIMKRVLPLAIAILLPLSLVGLVAGKHISIVTQRNDASTPAPTQATIETSDWLQHDDEVLGISFRYPPDWFLYPSTPEGFSRTTILASFDIEQAEGDESLYKSGEMKIIFSATDSISQNVDSLAEYVTENLISPTITEVTSQQIQINQLSGLRLDYTLFDQRESSIYLRRPADTLLVRATPIDTPLDAVLQELLTSIVTNN
jgi:hypothetical protein